MYAALWHHLPGGRIARAFQCLLMFVAVVVVLFVWVFPTVTPYLPFEDVTIEGTPPTPTSTTTPGATP